MREKDQFMTGPSGDADRSCSKTQYLFSSKAPCPDLELVQEVHIKKRKDGDNRELCFTTSCGCQVLWNNGPGSVFPLYPAGWPGSLTVFWDILSSNLFLSRLVPSQAWCCPRNCLVDTFQRKNTSPGFTELGFLGIGLVSAIDQSSKAAMPGKSFLSLPYQYIGVQADIGGKHCY